MKKLVLLFSLLVSCQDYNSNSSDKLKYGDLVIDDEGDPNYIGAYKIIQNKCIACHQSHHNGWIGFSPSQWLSSGFVAKGNPDSSPLIMATSNFGGTMPPTGSPGLTAEEYQTLRTWISDMP